MRVKLGEKKNLDLRTAAEACGLATPPPAEGIGGVVSVVDGESNFQEMPRTDGEPPLNASPERRCVPSPSWQGSWRASSPPRALGQA